MGVGAAVAGHHRGVQRDARRLAALLWRERKHNLPWRGAEVLRYCEAARAERLSAVRFYAASPQEHRAPVAGVSALERFAEVDCHRPARIRGWQTGSDAAGLG